MKRIVGEHWEFLRQFRKAFSTTGSIAPSSRFLARTMTQPLEARAHPLRILEVGPGTGAVTRRLVSILGPDDTLDLVELNKDFVALLERKFSQEEAYKKAADRTRIHCCALQEFKADAPYDIIISGLPMNNFPPELVSDIMSVFFQLLAPDGVLSYFEYMFMRSLRRKVAVGSNRNRMNALEKVLRPYLQENRFRRDWVFANFPPAWVQHLRHAPAEVEVATKSH